MGSNHPKPSKLREEKHLMQLRAAYPGTKDELLLIIGELNSIIMSLNNRLSSIGRGLYNGRT